MNLPLYYYRNTSTMGPPTTSSYTMGGLIRGIARGIGELAVITTMVGSILIVPALGVGPAPEAPAQLNIFARVAYYTTHRRFRDFFAPCLINELVNQSLNILEEGRWPNPIWRTGLSILCRSWLFSLGLMRIESYKFRDQPRSAEERRRWT